MTGDATQRTATQVVDDVWLRSLVRDIGDFPERGVTFRDQPPPLARMPAHELWMTFFHDSEGNTHAVMAEKRN